MKIQSFKLWQTARNGYRYNSLLLTLPFLVLAAIALAGYFSHGMGWYLYFECDHPTGCPNPLLAPKYGPDYIRFEYTFIDKEIKPVCEWDWCAMERLPPGTYGEKAPAYLRYAPHLFFASLALAFLLNHALFNRGLKPSIIIDGSLFEKALTKLQKMDLDDDG